MEIRRAYLRRSVKRARLQKRVLVAAMLAATGCAACLLQAEARNAMPDTPAPAAARRIDPYSIVPGGVLREAGFAPDGQNDEGQLFPLQSFPDGAGLLAAGQGRAAFRNDGLEHMALPGLPWHDRQAGLTLLKEPASNADSGMADGSLAGATAPAAGGSGDTSTGSSDDTTADGSGTVFTALLAVLAILAMLATPGASPSTPLARRLRKRRSSGAAAHQ
jgi:hypothetical protein